MRLPEVNYVTKSSIKITLLLVFSPIFNHRKFLPIYGLFEQMYAFIVIFYLPGVPKKSTPV